MFTRKLELEMKQQRKDYNTECERRKLVALLEQRATKAKAQRTMGRPQKTRGEPEEAAYTTADKSKFLPLYLFQ